MLVKANSRTNTQTQFSLKSNLSQKSGRNRGGISSRGSGNISRGSERHSGNSINSRKTANSGRQGSGQSNDELSQ